MRPVLILISGLLAIAASTAYAAPPPSGFLDTYPTMKPDPQRPGASLYVAPGSSLKGLVGEAKKMATAGPNIKLTSATLEAELLDPSGKQLAVVIDPLASGETKDQALTWAQIGEILDAAGKRLRTRMDADNPDAAAH